MLTRQSVDTMHVGKHPIIKWPLRRESNSIQRIGLWWSLQTSKLLLLCCGWFISVININKSPKICHY